MCPLVIASSTGAARSYASRSPPTIAKSCASSATETLPETGASSMYRWCRQASAASSATAAGPIVLISSTTEPGRSSSRRPLSTSTARAAGPSDTMVTTMSAAARSVGSAAAVAPSSTSGAQRSAVRFQTRSGNPARSRLWAMASPMRPMPANATVCTSTGRDDARTRPAVAGVSDKDLPAVHHVHLPGHVVGLGRGEVDEKRRQLGG